VCGFELIWRRKRFFVVVLGLVFLVGIGFIRGKFGEIGLEGCFGGDVFRIWCDGI